MVISFDGGESAKVLEISLIPSKIQPHPRFYRVFKHLRWVLAAVDQAVRRQ
jgi:hypothetical protein